jgi:amidase
VSETNPDAFAIADTLDAERRTGRIRGALQGTPVLVKDNVEMANGMTTAEGRAP